MRCVAKTVLKKIALVGLLSAVVGSAAYADNSAQSCQLRLVADLPMVENNHGVIVIPINFNGNNSEFILDTGAFWSTVREHATAGLEQKKSPIKAVGAGGGKNNQYVRAPFYQIGSLKLENQDFFVGPDLPGEGESLAGNLGVQSLKPFDVEIDPGRGRVKLFLPNGCSNPPVYWRQRDAMKVQFDMQDNSITIPVMLDGKPVRALIDTGASTSTLSLKTAKNKFGITAQSDGVLDSSGAATLDGAIAGMSKRQFDLLDIGGLQFRNPWLTLSEDKMRAASQRFMDLVYPDLILGMHQLRNLHLYIDFRRQYIYASTVKGDAIAEVESGNVNYVPKNYVDSSIDNENAAPSLKSAYEHFNGHQYELALEDINRALQYLPDDDKVFLFRGQNYFYMKNYAAALTDFSKALSLNGELFEAAFWRAQAYQKTNKTTEALIDLDTVIKGDPKHANAFAFRCWIYTEENKLDVALEDCSAAVALQPESYSAWHARALVNFRKAAYEQAIKDFTESLRLSPNNAEVLYWRGVAREKIGDKGGADDKKSAAQLRAGGSGNAAAKTSSVTSATTEAVN